MNIIKNEAEIWYLYNSGFAVKTAKHFLIFDYDLDTAEGEIRSLDCGVINPDEIKNLDVTVFVSHSHYDHFNPVIFQWRQEIKSIRYVLSYDIKKIDKSADITIVQPLQKYMINDMEVRVLDSTDIGVAFLIKVDGLRIYHAGDLNWWHWNEEPDADNLQMALNYKKQINSLKNEHIDIAFVPLDPRLEDNYALGLDYFMEAVGAELAIPIHFGNNYSVFKKFEQDESTVAYRDKVAVITHRGEKFIYP